MNSTKLAGIGLASALAFAVILPAIPAEAAGLSRTFLSPYRHLATAFAATAPDGKSMCWIRLMAR